MLEVKILVLKSFFSNLIAYKFFLEISVSKEMSQVGRTREGTISERVRETRRRRNTCVFNQLLVR